MILEVIFYDVVKRFARVACLLLFTLFFLPSIYSQTPVDTIDTDNGKMIIYSNRTWEYLKDLTFNGVLNERIHEIISNNPDLKYVQPWDNSVCYTSGRKNDLSKLKDTLWLCVNDEEHSDFVCPVNGVVTSRYGYRSGRHHSGIDLDLDIGDTVKAAWSGKVRYAKYNDGGFGNLVIIRHYNGLETFYAHLSKFLVVPDQEVKAGDVIGLGGNTGRSFGPHLHFEVRFYDAAMNPEEVIDFNLKKCKDDNLFVHASLFLPGAKPTDIFKASSQTTVVEETVVEEEPVVQAATRKYYKIRSGDTLSEIAARNKTTVSKLCQLNGISTRTTLQIGRSLRIQ
jgi:murein DD-endopeptidase MepM/ murein hydrolase activator NlpD